MNTTQKSITDTNVYNTNIKNTSHNNTNTSRGYFFNSSYMQNTSFKNNNASSLITSYFFSMKNNGLLHSNPTYTHTSTKVTIRVFYYISSSFKGKNKSSTISVFKNNITSLSDALSSIFGKEVSLEFTRVHYPYLNSSIFAQYLAHNAPTNTFVHFQDSILTYPSRNASELPGYITGIKIEVSGRLVTEPMVPRVTKKSYGVGSSSGGKVDYAKYTTKNFYGAFTIKV